MNKYWRTVILSILMTINGCVSTASHWETSESGASSGLEATGKPTADPKLAKHLVIHNESLAGDIIITNMRSRTTGDLLEVNVELANLTNGDMRVQYRFSWYDDKDFEVEQGTRTWVPLLLHGNATANLQAVAPNPTVTTYKVNVRELK